MFGEEILEAVAQACSVKKMFLEILQNSQENTCTRVSILIKLQASGLCHSKFFTACVYIFDWLSVLFYVIINSDKDHSLYLPFKEAVS